MSFLPFALLCALLPAASFSYAFSPLPPSSPCQLPAPQCPEYPTLPLQQPFAAFRSDVWIQDKYNEPLPAPTNGGRLQLIYSAASNVTETDIAAGKFFVNSHLIKCTVGSDMSIVQWARIEVAVDNKLLFVSLHSNNSDIFAVGKSVNFEITGGGGSLILNATFTLPPPAALTITYITTINNGTTLLAHIQATSASAPTIASVFVNSVNVTARVCFPSPASIAQGDSHILQVPLCSPVSVGDVMSLVLLLSDGSHVAGAVRRVKETMHISVWPKSTTCPLPKLDDDTAHALLDNGINAAYVYRHTAADPCGSKQTTEYYISQVLPDTDFHVMIADDFLRGTVQGDKGGLNDTSHVFAMMIADEDDTPKYPTSDLQQKLSVALAARASLRDVPTFQGGATNRNAGTYAGIADFQGVDAYVAACAPHFFNFFEKTLLRMPYDYALNTRANHMPLPTLVYSQFLDDMWKSVPQAPELIAQIAFTVAAGSKGLLLFQDGIKQYHDDPATFEQLGGVLKSIRSAGDTIMSGDVGGVHLQYDGHDDKVMVAALRSPTSYLVVAINLNADGYNGQLCNIDLTQHWRFHDQPLGDIAVTIAHDAAVSSVSELVNGTKVHASAGDM